MNGWRWLVVAVVLLVPAAPASADETIIAGPPFRYYTPQVTIDQGEYVTFTNVDAIEHDVVARGRGPDGAPLFRSERVSGGASSPVAGVEYLTNGAYEFYCSLHSNMVGTLEVTAAGTPKPRPGQPSPQPQPQPQPQPAADARSPAVSVKVLDRRLRPVRTRRALRLRITVDEPATIQLTASARSRTIASGSFQLERARTIRLRLTAAGRRALARAGRRLRVTVAAHATDAAGNSADAQTRRTLGR